MRKQIILFFLVVASFFSIEGYAQQNINPREIKISELSDSQIQQIYNEIMSRGLSEEQAMSLALARGFTSQQINELRQRFEALGLGADSSGQDSIQSLGGETSFGEQLSEKKVIIPGEEERNLFGFSFFNSENLTFEPSVNLPVSDSYIIGPGDVIYIDIWGVSEQSYQLTVDNSGNINIPGVGAVQIEGLTLGKAREKVFNKLVLIYSELKGDNPKTFANIYLGQIRPIKVHVIGDVFAPGSYTLPGTATVFNALYLAGGPNLNGSFRNIKVIREGKVIKTLDVYDYLINGNASHNITLRDDDVILVPAYLNRIRVGGEFKRTGIFEAKEGETVADMIKYAGGFTDKAYHDRVEIFRNESRRMLFRSLTTDQFESELVQNGDSLYAGVMTQRIENRVILEGAVMRPGNYELGDGLMLSELLNQADGLREDAFMERAQILRLDENNQLQNIPFSVKELIAGNFDLKLQREDIVTIYSIDDLRQQRTLEIRGEVASPGAYEYREGMTLADLIALSGGFLESASNSYIEISRRLSYEEASMYQVRTGHLFQFAVSRDLKLNAEDQEFVLQPFDKVYVRKAPGFVTTGSVKIAGEVIYAGDYTLTNRKERISALIKRAGGLTPEAFPEGAILTRKVEVSPKVKRLREKLMKQDTSLQFENLGFEVVAIDLREALKNPGSKDDIFLQDGDEIIIPRELQTVRIQGEVLNPNSTPFVKGRTLRYYINQSGGFSDSAKKGKTYVVYPNGKAAATTKFLFVRNYPKVFPGCEIIVPAKRQREPLPASAWISIGSSVASLALTVVTIVNAIN
ncbi:SLBB domain-containing protein [Thermophagus xiamenensis]|uniref:Protein involved in polysaccharide export, contains SLBB domain of the beta-grasp fold n=1 Tax=Thermophagus xiamenensis TaxID=385682 RepID=A0A1I2DNI8_9BACT|nr:SLBB domain-containing protein [Thermophagus xiamenensis]SFE82174.1 protein involved in polysaccharide export, contains SLBB domain of the beta-grasp fold [Thermophagus xiamenensis]